MKLILELPEEFREHFNRDKFQDSFMRICGDINEIYKSHCKPSFDSLGLSGNLEKELVDILKEAFKNADELSQVRKSYETATFYQMISRYEYSSGYGTNGENCIENFACNITFWHTPNKYWKLIKGGKTIAREAIYLGE